MSRTRPDGHPQPAHPGLPHTRSTPSLSVDSNNVHRPLRILASGTVFLTHTFSIPTQPNASTAPAVRAQAVHHKRSGSAPTVLSLLAQFGSHVEALLVAPLGGSAEADMIRTQLEKEGVSTRFCKVWKGVGAPAAWILNAADNGSRTVINHNPLPDITHEELVSALGPLLIPENYAIPELSSNTNPSYEAMPRISTASRPSNIPAAPTPVIAPRESLAPFDWLHFEGRSVKTTLNNIVGIDGLARERRWRDHCVFSVDIGRKGKQGVEALIPHVDIVFANKQYAIHNASHPSNAPTLRAFLLSMTSLVAPHALIVAYWGEGEGGGAGVLSLPTKEYIQSSSWAPDIHMSSAKTEEGAGNKSIASEYDQSVRSGSDFWAEPGHRSMSSGTFTAADISSDDSRYQSHSSRYNALDDVDHDNEDTATETGRSGPGEEMDEQGAQDAFVSGMIYALSRRVAPGTVHSPGAAGRGLRAAGGAEKWRLDECLRFATELAGRKARKKGWEGLAEEMAAAGW